MCRLHVLLAALLGVTSATSQVPFPTSPTGLAQTEGNSRFVHFSDAAGAARRFQQIDRTVLGNAWVIRSLGFRRDGTSVGGGSNEPPRTMILEICLGAADMTLLSGDFDRNFLAGTRSGVFTPKTVNMPDWTGLNGTPATFDFVVPFDAAYPYPGSMPLVIDFTYSNLVFTGSSGTLGGSWVDREYQMSSTVQGTSIGTGCLASGQTYPFGHTAWLENSGPGLPTCGMRLRVDGDHAAANAPVVLHVGARDPNLAIPGLCGTVHADPIVAFLVGVTDGSGDLARRWYSFAWNPNLVGITLVTQMAGLDPARPGLPVILSEGRQTSMPAYSGSPGREAAFMWATLPTGVDNTLFFGGGLVLQLGL
jgi:hypothetical protein